jgi:membrane-associated phospholipid phosphatase
MDAAAPQPLFSRIFVCIKAKLLLLLILPPLFNLCYFLPQWTPIFHTHQIPLTWVDVGVPFQPSWILPYMSMYLLLPLAPVLATRKEQLWRYTIGLSVMFGIAGVCFFLWPIAYPRPAMIEGAPAIYRLVTSMDQPINSLPSLHAGLTAYTLFFAARILADIPATKRRVILAIGWVWAAVILYGTLATKQHYLADLPPGILLAWVSHWWVWRKVEADESVGETIEPASANAVRAD